MTESGVARSIRRAAYEEIRSDIDDLRDLSRPRVLIEGAGLREAITEADVEYEVLVVVTHHRMSRTMRLTEETLAASDYWGNAHSLFKRSWREQPGWT